MLFAELLPLCQQLRNRRLHITIETAGTLFLPLECDLMSISPKLSNSAPSAAQAGSWRDRHEKTRHAPDVMRQLLSRYRYQLKFVVERLEDCREVEVYLQQFSEVDSTRVMLMPQATTRRQQVEIATWLEPFCRQRGWSFCPRRQLDWYGLQRGT